MLYKFSFIDKSPGILGYPFTMAWPLAAHNKVSMMDSSRSVLSDCPIVSRHLCTAPLLFVCLSPSSSPPSSPARLWLRSQGQSEVAPRSTPPPPPPSLPLESESLTRPRQLCPNRPTQQKRVSRVMGEGRARRQGDALSTMRSASTLTSWQPRWLPTPLSHTPT